MDMDGTICDSARGILNSVEYSLDYLGIATPDYDTLRAFLGPPIRVSYKNMFGLDGEELEAAVAKYRERYVPIGMFENDLYHGISDLIKDLKADGRKLSLATGKVQSMAADILEHFDLLQYFDFVAGCELDGRRSFKHEIIDYALDNLGAFDQKERAVMIGDRYHDIVGAAKSGVVSIGVLYGYGTREEIEEHSADYIAASVDELRSILL